MAHEQAAAQKAFISRSRPRPRPSPRVRAAAVGLTLALLSIAVACGGDGREARYREFSADAAVVDAADLPAGWELLPSDEVPLLREFFAETTELLDSALVVASNGEDDPSEVRLVAVGIALLGGDEGPSEEESLAGLAVRAAFPEIDLSQLSFLSVQTVDSPRAGSQRLSYVAAVDSIRLVTEAINLRDGRVLADIEIVYPLEAEPPLDLDELAALIYDRIAVQLVPQE